MVCVIFTERQKSELNKLFTKLLIHREGIFLIVAFFVYCILVYALQLQCPIYYVTGISCPGCGMTRAMFSILRFDFEKATYYHPLIYFCIAILPIMFIVHIKKMHRAKKVLTIGISVVFIVTYLYRFIILKSTVLLFNPEDGIFFRLISRIFS